MSYINLAARHAANLSAIAVSLCVFAPGQAALAQEAGRQAAASGNELGQVTVTARRQSENLQSVPVSITAVAQKEIENNDIKTLVDLQYLVPSMSAGSGNDGRSFPNVSIRGINGHATDGQGVITYLNEVSLPNGPQSETGGGAGLFYDLENVQVLKGPQGTLFGRNAIGGAILYQTQRPTNDFGGYVVATIGNHNNRELTGALNLPIADDKFLFRLAFNGSKRDGFTKSQGTADHPNGLDMDDRDYWAGRVTMTYRPTDRIQNDLIIDVIDENNNGVSQILTGLGSGGLAIVIFPGIVDALAEQQAIGARRQVETNTPSWSRSELTSFTDIFEFEATESLKFRNIASWSKIKSQFAGDWDGTIFPVISSAVGEGGPLETPYRMKTYSEEAQMLGTSLDGKLRWTVGGLYQKNPVMPEHNLLGEIFGGPIFGGPRPSSSYNAGLYMQGTYDLASWREGLSFTAGYRHSWDHIAIAESPGEKADFTAPSWTVGFDYQPSEDTLIYLASRRGYHAGGLNDLGGAAIVPYDEEYVTDVELGLKKDWTVGNVKARTNFAVYQADYTDFQTTAVEFVNGEITPVTSNAGEARVRGGEFEGLLYPTENLELSAQYSHLDFKYTDFSPDATNADTLRQTILANGPKDKYSIGARYQLPVSGDLGDISFSARWSWQSKTLLRFALQEQQSYGLLNLGMNWDHIGGKPLDASIFVTNALDKLYGVGGYSFIAGSLAIIGTQTTVYGEPRMYGLRLRYNFGDSE